MTVCPECHQPVPARGPRKDGRCAACRSQLGDRRTRTPTTRQQWRQSGDAYLTNLSRGEHP